ncbi:hypothetical protein PZ897_11190 [Hoeflea sp. YIM 152468]|uniref:hypothetical protein n=1 Tax=Hoeflea sp. YIM 152468 TaxID=3031759 RepID=UPI0023DA827E|nr:hypothetical protein [Hoeflea sp. YIM 152468]MDF1608743.1 hypothetical protein [Hoeflea sp. YIM 152468]
MTGMEAAIRGALDKAGIPGAQARRRIYDSARAALDRSLERQEISDPQRIDDHRQKLEMLIASIEAEWTPPGEAAAPAATTSSVRDWHEPAPDSTETDQATSYRPVYDTSEALGPEHNGPDQLAGSWGNVEPSAEIPHQPAPAVDAVSHQAPRPDAAPGDANLDFVPDASDHGAAAIPARGLAGNLAPHIEAADFGSAKRSASANKVKIPGPLKQKRRRPVFASIFSAAVMLSFLGIGVWWLIESGAMKSAAERDTGVPNPPPSLSRDDFAGGPQQLNPGAGFSGEWANVFTPGRDGEALARSDARAELIDEAEGTVLRIVSGSGDEDGEVLIPLGAEVMQALAGRQSVLALTVRAATPEPTQIYVKCAFSVLGDCGRRRFDVTYDTIDILFSLDYDRALAPNEAGNLVINSDISGGGKGIDLLAVRIKPLS